MARVRGTAAAVTFAAVLFAAAACGGGKNSGPANPAPDGGGSGGGGSGDGGSGGGGSSDPGSGGGTAGGGSGGDGTTGGGSGGGTTGGGSGGGGGTTGGNDACAGLVPAPDAGRALRFDTGTHTVCVRATSNANGQIALGFIGADGLTTFFLYPSDGSASQGRVSNLTHGSGADLDPWFHPSSGGWTGIVHDPPPAVAVRAFDGTGGTLGTGRDNAVSSAPDAHGGTVALTMAATTSGGPVGPTTLQWIDGHGGIVRAVALDGKPTMLLVDWATDHVLTLEPGPEGLRGRWYDGAGTPLTASFPAGPALEPGASSMHLLLDGSVALGSGQTWRVFRDGVAAVDPPPAWLAARPGTRLASIRNGRAYAVLPFPGGALAGAGPTSFEIVSAAGGSCGTVALPAPADEPGVTHAAAALDVGWDGTVFETEVLGGASLGQGIHCGFRWWPALLR